jgi:hypothetical protein
MVCERAQRVGVGFTFRHLIILGLYLVILFRVVIPLVEHAGYMHVGPIALASLLLTPPLLALLVACFERPGPIKNWAVTLLLCLFLPVLLLNHDFVVVHDYLVNGKRPTVWATVLMNVVILTSTLPYVSRLVPRRCPSCTQRALVPLLRLFKRDKRTANTRWCASCGGKLWRDREGTWRVERRSTWLDTPVETGTPTTENPPHYLGQDHRDEPSAAGPVQRERKPHLPTRLEEAPTPSGRA